MQFPKHKLADFLKDGTAAIHDAAENTMSKLKLSNESFSIDDYVRLMQVQLAFYKNNERVILTDQVNYEYQYKEPLILKDLEALNTEPEDYHFVIPDRLDFRGFLYVIEGSMMGGSLLYKSFLEKGIPENCLHFYRFCKEVGTRQWPSVKQYLNSCTEDPLLYDLILESAKFSFQSMDQIVEDYL